MNDRGQLLLVAGILLAVVFVALALLVNATIYTDNVATRGGDTASGALEYQAGSVDTVGGLIDAENAVTGDEDDFADVHGRVTSGVSEINATLRQNELRRAATSDISISGQTEGRLIREHNVSEFGNWTANASAVRGFVIDLDTENMSTGSSFRIDLNGTELEVNKTGGDIVVAKVSESSECRVNAAGVVRFDVTGGRLDGDPCRFGWPEFDTDSEIGIEDGDNGAGTYELTIESNDETEWLVPQTTVAVYSVDLELRIDSPELRYETTVRVAPGEPDV